MTANDRRSTCALNAPARPRSPVTGMIAIVSTCSRRCRSGRRTAPAARAVPAISSSIRSAYGRIASIRCCARRSRAEATSSIARVSLRVFVIERTRRFRSCVEANSGCFLVGTRLEPALDLLELRLQLRAGLVGQVARFADRLVDRALRPQMLAELVLEPRHVLGRDVVEVAVDARIERNGLLFHRPRLVLRLVEGRD